jgi:hypothetical protein
MDQEPESRIGAGMFGVYRYARGVHANSLATNRKRLYGSNNIICIRCLLLIICRSIARRADSEAKTEPLWRSANGHVKSISHEMSRQACVLWPTICV